MAELNKTQQKRESNKKYKTLLKTKIKEFKKKLSVQSEQSEKEKVKDLLKEIQSCLDKSVNKKVVHKNKSNRIKKAIFKKAKLIN